MRKHWLHLLVSALVLTPLVGQGLGDLMVSPTRVLLEGRTRAAELTLVNRGKEKATYRIFFTELDMDEKGQLQTHTKADKELRGSDLVRYAPKQVDLEPGATQIVRLQVRKPENLPPGDYRSHLLLRALPATEAALAEGEENPKDMSISVQPIYGISIPVIVRHGDPKAEVNLTALILEPNIDPMARPALAFRLERQGNRTVYGDLAVTFQPRNKKAITVGETRGIAIYTNLPSRPFRISLNQAKDVPIKDGQLKVTFTFQDTKPPAASAVLDLP